MLTVSSRRRTWFHSRITSRPLTSWRDHSDDDWGRRARALDQCSRQHSSHQAADRILQQAALRKRCTCRIIIIVVVVIIIIQSSRITRRSYWHQNMLFYRLLSIKFGFVWYSKQTIRRFPGAYVYDYTSVSCVGKTKNWWWQIQIVIRLKSRLNRFCDGYDDFMFQRSWWNLEIWELRFGPKRPVRLRWDDIWEKDLNSFLQTDLDLIGHWEFTWDFAHIIARYLVKNKLFLPAAFPPTRRNAELRRSSEQMNR